MFLSDHFHGFIVTKEHKRLLIRQQNGGCMHDRWMFGWMEKWKWSQLQPLSTDDSLFSSFVSRGPAAALYPLLFDPVKDSAGSEMSQYLTVCVSMTKV